MHILWWREKKTDTWEEVDTADTEEERSALLTEYRIAYHQKGQFKWTEEAKENPPVEADMSFCKNKKCRKKINCRRFKPISDLWDSYIQVKDHANCNYYLPIDLKYSPSKKGKSNARQKK